MGHNISWGNERDPSINWKPKSLDLLVLKSNSVILLKIKTILHYFTSYLGDKVI